MNTRTCGDGIKALLQKGWVNKIPSWRRALSIVAAIIAASACAIVLLIAIGYGFALDWKKQHTQSVTELDLYTIDSTDGIYRLPANHLEFRVRIAGPPDAPQKMLLLHGFPESSIKWQDLMSILADVGIRVAAFDQRGYSPGARPKNAEGYDSELLVDDVIAVADALGFQRFHLLGHDWGAVVGWLSVFRHPERIRSWTALAIPHPQPFFGDILNGGEQASRSGYFDFFKKPILPELIAQYRLSTSLQHLSENRRAEYSAILSEPGAFTAALNWYRAMDIPLLVQKVKAFPKIEVPTLFIGGTQDVVVAQSTVEAQRELMAGPFQSHMLNTGHGIIEEEFGEVTELILEHIK